MIFDLVSAYAAAQKLAGNDGRLAVGEKTLAKRLDEAGLLKTTEAEQGKLTVRKQIKGERRRVHHLSAYSLFAKSDQWGQSDQSRTEANHPPGKNGANPERNGATSNQNGASATQDVRVTGSIGPMAPFSRKITSPTQAAPLRPQRPSVKRTISSESYSCSSGRRRPGDGSPPSPETLLPELWAAHHAPGLDRALLRAMRRCRIRSCR